MNSNDGKKIYINEDAKKFAKSSYKKFKKKNEDIYDSKKELREAYNSRLFDLLPDTIEFLVKFGHIMNQEVQEVKNGIYEKLNDEKFCKALYKEIKNGGELENIMLLPIILSDILRKVDAWNKELLAKNPNDNIYETSHLIELSKLILKKKLKKFNKRNIDETLAFDILSVMPCDKIMEISKQYTIRMVYEVLYEHAKTKKISFDEIIKVLVNEKYVPAFILYALLERKERFANLNDSQKQLYLAISNWVFNTMENLEKDTIKEILESFVAIRKKDDRNGKDANRRYALSTLSETDYPNITKMIKRIVSDDGDTQKYF